MNMSDKKQKRRRKEQREKDMVKIFKQFRGGSLKSQYEGYHKRVDLREIADPTLRRDLINLKNSSYLKVKIGPRNAKIYSLTFKGLIHGLKIGAFTLENMRETRLKNKLELPTMEMLPLPNAIQPVSDLKIITERMEKLEPEAFYSLLRKFDLDEAPRDVLPIACLMAGFITILIEYFLDPTAVEQQLKGTKAVVKLKDGTKWEVGHGLPLCLSLLYAFKSIMPENMQKLIEEKFKEMGFKPSNLSFSLEGIF